MVKLAKGGGERDGVYIHCKLLKKLYQFIEHQVNHIIIGYKVQVF